MGGVMMIGFSICRCKGDAGLIFSSSFLLLFIVDLNSVFCLPSHVIIIKIFFFFFVFFENVSQSTEVFTHRHEVGDQHEASAFCACNTHEDIAPQNSNNRGVNKFCVYVCICVYVLL